MASRQATYWHDDPATHPPLGTWMWHLHHEALCEPLTAPLAERLAYIRSDKPAAEIDLRLRLIDIVADEIPAPLAKAGAAYAKAGAATDKGWAASAKAWAAYAKARAAALPALVALHATEHPGCPWDGKSIFGKADQ